MSGYIGVQPVPQATQRREYFTATSGQTTFNTNGYTPGYIDVFMNGVKLSPSDFTATNGSDVVLASGATTGDLLQVISFTPFNVANQTFIGNVNLSSGGYQIGGNTVIDSSRNIDGVQGTFMVDDNTEYSDTEDSELNPVGTDALYLFNNESTSTNGKVSLLMRSRGSGGAAAGRITLENSRSGAGAFNFFLRDNSHTGEQQAKLTLNSDGDLNLLQGSLLINSTTAITSSGGVRVPNGQDLRVGNAASNTGKLQIYLGNTTAYRLDVFGTTTAREVLFQGSSSGGKYNFRFKNEGSGGADVDISDGGLQIGGNTVIDSSQNILAPNVTISSTNSNEFTFTRSETSKTTLGFGTANQSIASTGPLSIKPDGTTVNKYTFESNQFTITPDVSIGGGTNQTWAQLAIRKSNDAAGVALESGATNGLTYEIQSGPSGNFLFYDRSNSRYLYSGVNTQQDWYVSGQVAMTLNSTGLRMAAGKGIEFSPYGVGTNISSNTLDDYEEGTWTPHYQDSAGNTYTGSYSTNNGRYTKVGRMVHCTWEIIASGSLTSNGLTGTNYIEVGGFPFVNNSTHFVAGQFSNGNGVNYGGDFFLPVMDRGDDAIFYRTFTSSTGGIEGKVSVNQANNGSRLIYGTITYSTTT